MTANLTKRLAKIVGLTPQELSDVWQIITETLVVETTIDVAGSLDPTFITALGVEIPEVGLDIMMCVRIWQYFNNQTLNEANKLDFIETMRGNPMETAGSALLAYSITSVLKFAIGKVAGKAAFYVGSPIVSGGINAIQTITTGLLWAKYIKKRAGSSAAAAGFSPA